MDPVLRRAPEVGAMFAISRAWREGSGEPARESAFGSQLVVEFSPQRRSALIGSSLAAVGVPTQGSESRSPRTVRSSM